MHTDRIEPQYSMPKQNERFSVDILIDLLMMSIKRALVFANITVCTYSGTSQAKTFSVFCANIS